MDSKRKTAIIVGVLFIIATVAPIVSAFFVGFIYESDYLSAVSANENQVLIGVLLLLTMTAAIVSIPIVMFPILRKYDESLALGYVGAIYNIIKSGICTRSNSSYFLFSNFRRFTTSRI